MLRRRNVGANGGGGATEDAGEEDRSIANPASPPFIEEVPSTAARSEGVKTAKEAEDSPRKEAESEAKEAPAKAAVRRADPRLRALLIEALTQGKCPRAYVLFSPSGIREFVEILPPPEVHGRDPASVVDEMLEGQGDSHDWTFGLALPKTPEGQEGKLIIGGIILDIEAMGGQSATLGMRASKFVKWLALPPANGNLADRNSPWCFNGLHVLVGLGAWLVVCLCHGLYKGRGLTSTLSLQAPGRKVLEEQLERNLASIPVPEDSPLYTQYRKYYMDEFQKLAAQTEAFRPTAQKGVGAFSLHSLLDVHMDWQAFLQTFSNGVIVLFVLAILSSFVRVYILPGGSSPQGFWSWALHKMKTGEEPSAKATADAAATAAAPASSPQESEEAEEAAAAEVPESEEAKPARPVPVPLTPTVEEAEPGPATVSLSPTSEAQPAPAVPDDAALPLAPVPAASTGQKQGLPFILEGPNGEPMVVHLPLPSARAPEAPSPSAQAAEKQPPAAATSQRIDYGASPQRQKLQRKIAAREQKAQPPRAAAASAAAAPVPAGEELAASGDDPLGDEVAVEALLRELEGTPKVSKKKRNSLQKQPAQGRTPKGASAKGQQEAELETSVEEVPRQPAAKEMEASEPVLTEPSTDRGAAAEEAATPAPSAAAPPAAGSGKRKGAQAAKEQAGSPPAQQELKPEAKSKQGKPVAVPTVVPQSQASPTAARKAKVAPPAAADVREQPGPAASQRPKSKPSNPSGSEAGRSPAAPKPAAVQRTESQDQPQLPAEAEPLLEGGDGEWDIALSRSTRRRSRASTDASAGPPASPGTEIAEPAPSPGSEARQPQTPPAGQNGSEKGSRSRVSNGSKQTPANRMPAEEAPTLPECSNFIAAHSPEACKPMDGAAEAVLDELKQMRKDELLRWFNANSALGWLHDRLTGAQIMECTPKSVLLDHAALLLGSAASAQKEAEKASREPLQAKGEEVQEGDGPCEAAASPAPPTPPPAVAPIPAASLAPTAAARGAVAATPIVPVRPPVAAPLVPAMPAPLKAAPKAWAAVAGKAPEAVSPLVPPPRGVAGAVEETPIRFGDFEPPAVPPPAPPPSQSEQPDTAAGPPSQASDIVEGAAAGHPGLAAQQDPSHGACLSKEALLQQQQLQQQHPMMVMQPTLTAGGMMLPCMPGMAPMMGFVPGMQANQWQHPEAPMMGFVPNMQASQWQVPEAGQAAPAIQGNPPAQQGPENQAGCQRLMPNMPGADVLGMQQAMAAQQAAMSGKQVMPFVPFMPAMAGAAGMGQQAMQQQFLPVMFAVPFNAVSQEGGAAGNMQGMMVPMPMAATGEFGGAMSCGTIPAGMSTQQAAAMGMPFASASESGAGSCVNIKSSQNT